MGRHRAAAFSSITEERFEAAAEEAEANGCEVVYGGSNHLLLDYDGDGLSLWAENKPRLERIAKVVREEWWSSKSHMPGHLHARITLDKELTVPERSALQACLGSDPVREIINLTRWKHGVAEPVRLFRPKDAEVTVKDYKLEADLQLALGDKDDDLPF